MITLKSRNICRPSKLVKLRLAILSCLSLTRNMEALALACACIVLGIALGLAVAKLIVPRTGEEEARSSGARSNIHRTWIADTVPLFISLQDKLQMDILAKEDLVDDVEDLWSNLDTILPDDFEGTDKVGKWHKILATLEAGDCINKGQARQMAFDLESAYDAFNAAIKRNLNRL